ncbi:MAG: hypothetical protein ACHRHE_20880 [Tepidisphaerales bacterium]
MTHLGKLELDRRKFLAVACGAAAAIGSAPSAWAQETGRPVPLIHQTDLFRPHVDPDDHFDLACVFGLARLKKVRLLGVLCDYPPPGHGGDPDISAVAMLNRVTGLAAPLVTGSSQKPATRRDKLESASPRDLHGVNWLLQTLRDSPEPAVVTIVGSCRDVAVAGRREPELFARKCRAIYLNAGTGAPDRRPGDGVEYNVQLDPGSYAGVFDIPCPVYWMPCFERLAGGKFVGERHGTYYTFTMGELFTKLSPAMQRYFLSMLEKETGTRWLESLNRPVDPALLERWGRQVRNMWCTAGFLHLAGLEMGSDVYRFVPVKVECDDAGQTKWTEGESRPARFKFEATDRAQYAGAMTKAMVELMAGMGRESER